MATCIPYVNANVIGTHFDVDWCIINPYSGSEISLIDYLACDIVYERGFAYFAIAD